MPAAVSGREDPAPPLSTEEAASFLFQEARLLDERQFEAWRDLFTEDGYYWVPARPDQPNPLDEVSIFYDDKELMETRIQRLRHPRIHAQIPHTRTAHLVTNVMLEHEVPPEADVLVYSKIMVVTYRQNQQDVYAGDCHHALRWEESRWRIAWKKVALINSDAMLKSLFVPF
ncbi:MAG: aromatic-ring-hydroxylating dioxygenase subunit beta [Alphaproteobacteria bacterium]|nr:aromatic-ring-hydroxylating dioxygenase subunit beta [Alphaproteobacteria bacterium]